MKITKETEELIPELKATSRYRKEAIKAYREKHGIKQALLASRMNCNQSTLSRKLNPNCVKNISNPYWYLSLSEAKKICEAMGTTLGNVLQEYDAQDSQNSPKYSDDELYSDFGQDLSENIPSQCRNIPNNSYPVYPACLFPDNANLVNNKTNKLFRPWFGTFHCYFYSTLSNESHCFHGILEIPEMPLEGCCNVNFHFTYDLNQHLDKRYYGQLVLSTNQRGGAYCTLVNHDDQGEITYLVMANPAIKNSSVCCVLAFVSTISAGKGTNHPCVERMIISRAPLKDRALEMAKVHLLLNDKKIRITEEAFCTMLRTEALPEAFKQRFSDCEHIFDMSELSGYLLRMAEIPESWVKALPKCTEQEQQLIIDYMRRYSIAPKYNKIKEKTAENDIYEMIRDQLENQN